MAEFRAGERGGGGRELKSEVERARQYEGGLKADRAGRNGREITAIMRRNSSHNKTPLLK